MNRKIAFVGGGSVLSAGTIYIGLPLALGLGAASACACAQRTADNLAKWESCAKGRIAAKQADDVLPTTRFIETKNANGDTVDAKWTKPVSNPRFEALLASDISPACGSFADMKKKDSRIAWWRETYGYEALWVPEDASALLAKAVF